MERAVYRIIDANFNRAREALRVMEEYCRFALNCEPLSGRTKQLRHELCAAIARLESGRLLAGRDTLGDVGVGQRVEHQLQRVTLADAFTAGAKRLTEALRALTETIQTESPQTASIVERLRYDAYTLEKDIVLFAEPAERFKRVRLYVMITSSLPADVLFLTSQCATHGADCIQLRAKGLADDQCFALATEFVEMCKETGVVGIINDRADIAIASGADGVHLGQNDLPIEQVRRLQLSPLIVGRSTHNVEELKRATDSLASYVSLGPVFPTPTKPGIETAGFDYVRQGLEHLSGTGVGHVAIGGITAGNVESVLAAGARCVAVCSAVAGATHPAETCQRLKDRISEYFEKNRG